LPPKISMTQRASFFPRDGRPWRDRRHWTDFTKVRPYTYAIDAHVIFSDNVRRDTRVRTVTRTLFCRT